MITDQEHPQRDWNLEINNLGRVVEAKITLSPLVLLVGKNNTGKSYVASTIWALRDIFDVWTSSSVELPDWYDDFWQAASDNAEVQSMVFTPAQVQDLIDLTNVALKDSSSFLSDVFKFRGFQNSRIKITPGNVPTGYEMSFGRISVTSGGEQTTSFYANIKAPGGFSLLNLRYPDEALENYRFLAKYMLAALTTAILYGGRNPTFDALYLPAGRTGLLLAQKAFGTGLAIEGDEQITLPAPVTNFMHRLARVRRDSGKTRP